MLTGGLKKMKAPQFKQKQTFSKQEASVRATSVKPNIWDIIAFLLVFSVIFLFAWAGLQMAQPYNLGEVIPISLSPTMLPYYALYSVARMLIALLFSLLFTFMVGTIAARYKTAERLIIPIIDIMQSIPVLGVLPIAVWGGLLLFPKSRLGPECAALIAIFTSQVWNITLSFYQSLKTVPVRLKETAYLLQLNTWQRFWRVEVPFAMPGLLWNAIISMSAAWFFVVASEAISIAHQTITLPGIGSYIAKAIVQADLTAIGYAIIAMFFVILIYDQLLFRPTVQWAEKFRVDGSPTEKNTRTWVSILFHKTRLMSYIGSVFETASDRFVNIRLFSRSSKKAHNTPPEAYSNNKPRHLFLKASYYTTITASVIIMVYLLAPFIHSSLIQTDIRQLIYLGAVTTLRIAILIALCLLVWVPVGVWIGLRPPAIRLLQPIIQFLAAFPANLLFPLVAITIVRYHLNVNIWTSPLMILGTQWYILFNVIAGTSKLPKSLHHAAKTLHVNGWLRWRRLILPSIFPDLVTGTITAVGGAWNASIIAEAVDWGTIKLRATGLGAAITQAANKGNSSELALGITVMSLFVLIINRLVWRPLYNKSKPSIDREWQ